MDVHSRETRNLAFVGQSGAGKTALAEALLREAGALSPATDFGWLESDLSAAHGGHTLGLNMCTFSHLGMEVHLLDTPGLPDLIGRAWSAVPAVETVLIVINATRGLEPLARRAMDFAKDRGKCRALIVNHIDAPGVDLAGLMAEIREEFGSVCLPLNLPADNGQRVEDCFFTPAGGETDFSSVAEMHTQLVDQVVELDEALMETYLERGEVAPESLHEPFETALRNSHLIPVCHVSARTGAGVSELLHTLAQLMPNPGEGNPPTFVDGEGSSAQPVEIVPEADRHAVAHVFDIRIDPYLGRVGMFRLHQGTIETGGQLYVGDSRRPIKVGHLYKPHGAELVEISRAVPGDICALTRCDELFFDAVLHDSKEETNYHLRTLALPRPMVGLAIEAEKRGEEQKLSEALHKLAAEDPSMVIEHDPATRETIIRGIGELHLQLLIERMAKRDHVQVKCKSPSVPYRETISRGAEGHCRHKKQSGGAGQFGEVFLRIEPLDRGAGFEFVDAIVGGAIPRQFIPAVEKGINEALAAGVVAGYPIQDVRVTLYDGKHHPVDSKEVAFVAAGRKAFTEAAKKASPLILEPIVALEVTTPSGHIGDVSGDIASHRGRLSGTATTSRETALLCGEIPLAELSTYPSRLKSLTEGQGTFSATLSHYAPVPAKVQQTIISARQQSSP